MINNINVSKINVEYAEGYVPFWNYNYAEIVLTYGGTLYARGMDSNYFTKNDLHSWSIPTDTLNDSLIGVMEEIVPYCSKLVDLVEQYDNSDNVEMDLQFEIDDVIHEIDHIIDDEIRGYELARAVVFPADYHVMEEWFINGETPAEIERYVQPKLVREDVWVYFPDSPEDYKETAKKYYSE